VSGRVVAQRGQVDPKSPLVGYWDGVDQDDSGVASAMVNTMQQVGGALGLAIFTSISTSAVGRYVSSHAGQRRDRLQTLAALSSYHTVFWVAAGVFVAGAVLTGLPKITSTRGLDR
jgi:hypothetical protein